jgi:uncharacterized protein (DUF952 family)
MRVFHIATASDWAQAQEQGSYTTSTRGRTLAEVGFVHCSQDFQVETVRRAIYDDLEDPLVLLAVETDRLTSPWQLDAVPGSDDPFPHIYGPLNLDAVVAVTPVER